jgi:PAS domain S-box-containing protein
MHSEVEICLISRDEDLAREVEGALTSAGLPMRRIDGPEPLLRERSTRPRLALIDGHLGGTNAIQICERLRSAHGPARLGILALLSKAEDETMDALLTAGGDDVVSRRVRPWGFRARIESHLRRLETAAELARKVDDSQLLIELTSRLVGVGDLLGNLYDMARLLSKELDVTRCSVVLVRPEQDLGLVIASSDNPEVRSLPIDLDRYPEIRRVTREVEPLVVTDVADSALLREVLADMRSANVTSVALFPIARDDEILGVIFLRFTRRREKFEERELVFCQTVANATAAALRNAEILKLLEDKTAEIEKIQNAARTQVLALKRYEDFFLSSVDGMLVLDEKGLALFANPQGAHLLGRDEEEIVGTEVKSLIREEDRPRFRELIEAGRTHRPARAVDLSARDEAERVLSVSAGPLGEESMTLLTIRDVTEERSMARRLAEAQEKLIEGEKRTAMMEVAGAAAHELNQPLTSVMTTLAMLHRIVDGADEKTRRLVKTLEGEAERMASIIRRLSKLTEYTTTSYVGEARIIDLERAAGKAEHEEDS